MGSGEAAVGIVHAETSPSTPLAAIQVLGSSGGSGRGGLGVAGGWAPSFAASATAEFPSGVSLATGAFGVVHPERSTSLLVLPSRPESAVPPMLITRGPVSEQEVGSVRLETSAAPAALPYVSRNAVPPVMVEGGSPSGALPAAPLVRVVHPETSAAPPGLPASAAIWIGGSGFGTLPTMVPPSVIAQPFSPGALLGAPGSDHPQISAAPTVLPAVPVSMGPVIVTGGSSPGALPVAPMPGVVYPETSAVPPSPHPFPPVVMGAGSSSGALPVASAGDAVHPERFEILPRLPAAAVSGEYPAAVTGGSSPSGLPIAPAGGLVQPGTFSSMPTLVVPPMLQTGGSGGSGHVQAVGSVDASTDIDASAIGVVHAETSVAPLEISGSGGSGGSGAPGGSGGLSSVQDETFAAATASTHPSLSERLPIHVDQSVGESTASPRASSIGDFAHDADGIEREESSGEFPMLSIFLVVLAFSIILLCRKLTRDKAKRALRGYRPVHDGRRGLYSTEDDEFGLDDDEERSTGSTGHVQPRRTCQGVLSISGPEVHETLEKDDAQKRQTPFVGSSSEVTEQTTFGRETDFLDDLDLS